MAFAITQLPNRPVLWVMVDVPVENYLSSYQVLNRQLHQIIAGMSGPFHIWLDARTLNLSFSDVLLATQKIVPQVPGLSQMSQVQWAVIGTHPLIEIALGRVKREFGLHVTHFATLEEALDQLDDDLSQAGP